MIRRTTTQKPAQMKSLHLKKDNKQLINNKNKRRSQVVKKSKRKAKIRVNKNLPLLPNSKAFGSSRTIYTRIAKRLN